jgi:signal transduction histidine kinase
MLAHEVKRRVSALRVAAEAVGILQQRGSDPQAMLDRLLGEIHELEELTRTLLDRDRASAREVTDLVGAAQAAADTVRTASRASVVLAHPSEPVGAFAQLALVRHVTESVGGQIWARGRPGGGTLFGLRLPAASAGLGG